MKNWFNYKYLMAPILGIILSVPAVATAVATKHGAQTETMKITVSDLDLSQEDGILTLYQRLKTSAGKVCGVKDSHVTGSRIASFKIKRQHKKCSAEALNNAVQSFNNKMLTDLHRNKT
jgi:UrcA family protein